MKPAMPGVSVIIPTYNAARYIGEAIGSVLAQTYQSTEIIVIDDGSTDDTHTVVSGYLHHPAIQYVRQENRGPSAARNAGIRRARGRFITFLDADDSIPPTSLARRVGFLEKYSHVTAVFTDLLFQRDPQRPATVGHYRARENFPDGVDPAAIDFQDGTELVFNDRFFEHFVRMRIGMWPGNLMLRRRRDGQLDLFREDLVCGEITEFAYRIVPTHVVGYIDEPLFTYNEYRSVLTRDYIRGVPAYIEVLESLKRDLTDGSRRWAHLIPPLNRQIGSHYLVLGYHEFSKGAFGAARPLLMKSLLYRPGQVHGYIYLGLSLLPPAAVRAVGAVKRRMRELSGRKPSRRA